MSNNLENIDQLFKGNLQNATIPAPAGTWEAVSSQMAGAAAGGTATGLTILKVAITIAIAAGSGLVVHKLTNTKKVSPQVETAEVLTAIKKEEVKDLDGNLDFKIEDSSKPIQVTAINKVKISQINEADMFISAEEDLLKPDESKALINKPIEASEVITQSKIPNANVPKIKKEEPEQIKANEKTDVALEKESPKSIHLFPDVITPNQDGANDSFYIDMDVPVLYQLTISSSSGQTFFVSTNPKEKWDGKYNGRMMPYGFYIATLVYQFNPESKAESKTQLIELKRNK